MISSLIKEIDSASVFIVTLKSIMRRIQYDSAIEPGVFQQLLDKETLYIKQIPKDSTNVFRAIADVIKLSQSEFNSIISSYISMIRSNYSVILLYILVSRIV